MKKTISVVLVFMLYVMLSSCTQYHAQGAGTGGLIGGIAGALLDSKNPWRGGVIGGALGAVAGATFTDISTRAGRQVANTGEPVAYTTVDGKGVYRADPIDYDAHTKCRKVRERAWEKDVLVKDQIKEVCEGEKFERTY